MSMEFIYVEDQISDKKLLPDFDICQSNTNVFSLMQLQCHAEVTFNVSHGPRVVNLDHYNLCRAALIATKAKEADILVTPEYSFPIELISEMVIDEDIQPAIGKIWCLACQGEPLTKFEKLVSDWSNKGAYIINASLLNVHRKKFVNAIIYVFKLTNKRLCIVPQLKTYPMADRSLEGEGPNLTLGKKIVLFGKGQSNVLGGFICSDVLNNELLPKLMERQEHLILIHPQMNEKPRQHDFSRLREYIYRTAFGDRCIVITANWAYGTKINGSAYTFNNPWSCIYIKNYDPDWVNTYRQIRQKNFSAGQGFAYWEECRTHIWYSFKSEHLKFVFIKKPRQNGPKVCEPNLEVSNIETFTPSDTRNSWEPADLKFDLSLNKLLEVDNCYQFPLNAQLEERDIFFGLSLGTLEEGQLTALRDETCERVGLHIDDECEALRIEAIGKFLKLIECLTDKCVPVYLQKLRNTHKFGLTQHPFNLLPLDDNEEDGALVAYVEKNAEQIAKKYIRLINNEEKVCIFTHDFGTSKITTLPKYNVSIVTGENFSDTTVFVSDYEEGE